MRYIIQGVARDSYGVILPFESIEIFINNTETCATVYDTETSTNKLDTCPQIQTDKRGIFDIYFDSEDYDDLTTTFDLNVGNQSFTDIEPFKVDKRVLNTTESEGMSVYDAYNPEKINIDGGTF